MNTSAINTVNGQDFNTLSSDIQDQVINNLEHHLQVWVREDQCIYGGESVIRVYSGACLNPESAIGIYTK